MKIQRPLRGERGFSLVELLVVIVVAMILMAIAVPTLQTQLRQGKLRGAASQAAVLLRLARLEAIKHSGQGIVYIVPATATEPGRMEAYADRDSDGIQDPEEAVVSRFVLPKGVDFVAPPDLEGADSVAGFTVDDDGGPNEAVFLRDGSIRNTGAFRFADEHGNFLQVRVEPQATARVELQKCLLCTDAEEDTDWYAPGDNAGHLGKAGEAWETWK
ncbi:MAG TPA: GspH/FimT family protein [Thermoanaerobaculia bacterium]|nr:GspH/FimT family protein [Thermoanaerobaculia bacterium]